MIHPESPEGSGTTVGDLIPGYPKEEESMHHRTVKTPESAAVSLARANRSLAPPRPTPEGWARPRPTAGGQLRLARRLDNNSPDPQGIHSASPDPRGLGSAPPDGRGTPPLRPTVKARFYLIQRPLTDLVLNRYPEAGSAHLTKHTPHPHDGDYRVKTRHSGQTAATDAMPCTPAERYRQDVAEPSI